MNELIKFLQSEGAKGKGRVASRSVSHLALAALLYFGNELRRDMTDLKDHRCRCDRNMTAFQTTNTFAHAR